MKKIILPLIALAALSYQCKSTTETIELNNSSESLPIEESKLGPEETETTSFEAVDADEQDTVLIGIKTTACYGTCPIIQFKLYYSGRMYLNAEQNYKSYSGEYTAQASDSSIAVLIRTAYNANFFKLDSEYDRPVTDLPSRYVYFNHSGQKKEIHLRMNVPDELKDFESEIMDLIGRTDWEAEE